MTEIIMTPLAKLVESEDNVRRANRKSGVSELASSIKCHGPLQSIVVRETPQGKFRSSQEAGGCAPCGCAQEAASESLTNSHLPPSRTEPPNAAAGQVDSNGMGGDEVGVQRPIINEGLYAFDPHHARRRAFNCYRRKPTAPLETGRSAVKAHG